MWEYFVQRYSDVFPTITTTTTTTHYPASWLGQQQHTNMKAQTVKGAVSTKTLNTKEH
jgi:hypothetical protein